MSDKDTNATRAREWGQLTVEEMARLAGDPINEQNKMFWHIAWNLITYSYGAGCTIPPTGPEFARLVELSKAIIASSRYGDWASADALCDRLFEGLDGGEELGLSDEFYGVDWRDETQRTAALIRGMRFHRVPKSFQPAVADLVSRMMLATDESWIFEGTQLRQPWAQFCAYMVGAIAQRVKATDDGTGVWDGQHRAAGFH